MRSTRVPALLYCPDMSVPSAATALLRGTPAVIVITGAMAAGKSTVADAFSRRLPLAAHVRGDTFRRFIVSGQESMAPPLTTSARRQLELRHTIAAQVADTYAAAGITPVVQDILLGPDLAKFVAKVRTRPRYTFILAPDAASLSARDRTRHKHTYGAWTPEQFEDEVRRTSGGLHVDSTGWSVEETVGYLLAHLDEARTQ